MEDETPEQETPRSLKERADLRHSYRRLIDDMRGDEAEDPNNLERLDKLFQKVTKPREMSYDAQAVALFSSNQFLKVEQLKTNLVAFDCMDFADKVLSFMEVGMLGNEDADDERPTIPNNSWVKLGRSICHHIRTVPNYSFLYGSLEQGEVVVKPPRVRAERVKDDDKQKQAVVPKQLTNIDTEKQEKTTQEVQRIFSILVRTYNKNRKEPLCYFWFSVDPNSYSHTVENMFHIAFLVREGKATLTMDNNKLPVITPVVSNEEDEGNERPDKESQQVIIAMTMEQYRDIIKAFNIDRAVIPDIITRNQHTE